MYTYHTHHLIDKVIHTFLLGNFARKSGLQSSDTFLEAAALLLLSFCNSVPNICNSVLNQYGIGRKCENPSPLFQPALINKHTIILIYSVKCIVELIIIQLSYVYYIIILIQYKAYKSCDLQYFSLIYPPLKTMLHLPGDKLPAIFGFILHKHVGVF